MMVWLFVAIVGMIASIVILNSFKEDFIDKDDEESNL